MARQPGSSEPDDGDARAEGAARIARAAAAGRNRLLSDANLIDALVRIDEIEVATRAIAEQRADLVEYAIDLREAVAEAVQTRDAADQEAAE
ncbi:MAG TPA: hypothetical protein VNU01_08750 [Egibacteraceae bacterium]|nr:hypothetical protein [Egibacteraceae bacterium]